MKIDFLNSSVTIRMVKFAARILQKMPFSTSVRAGRFLGGLFYLFSGKAGKIAYANLRMAFSYKYSPARLRKITAGIFKHIGINIVEVLRFPLLDKQYIEKYVEVIGFEKIEQAVAGGKGVVLLTAHFGNWELSAQTSSVKGFPMMVLATEQKHSGLNDLLNQYRSLHGSEVITKGFQLREILRGLKNKKIAGILCDQDGGQDGIKIDFLGRSATAARGPFEIAAKNNSEILPCFSVRKKDGKHVIYVGDNLAEGDENESEKEVLFNKWAVAFSRLLEEKIIEFPEQWLWSLKRWKSGSERAIVVISDGKAGHLTQSRAAAEIIRRQFADKGLRVVADYKDKKDGYKIIEIKFKNEAMRILFKIAVYFFGALKQCPWGFLKLVLDASSFKEIQGCYADIFISTGSAAAGINLLISRENRAKSVVVMKPFLPLAWFDLSVVPEHDKVVKENKKVIRTLGAPVYLPPEFIEEKAAELKAKLGLEGGNYISLFFGGETPFFVYKKEQITKIITAVKEAAHEINAKILITTSRRTPAWLEKFLEEEFGQDAKGAFLLIANKNNIADAVPGFLGLSRVAVVSGESISMVSESLSTDKQLIVFMPDKKKNKVTKQEKFIQQLETGGYLKIADENLKNQIIGLFSAGRRAPFSVNEEKLRKAVECLE